MEKFYNLIEYLCKSFRLAIETLLEENGPLVEENYPTEKRHQSKIFFLYFWECGDFDGKNQQINI